MTDVKICGITNGGDARVAVESGARYIGAVMVPSSPRRVDPDRARHFARGLDARLVMVVADEPLSAVVDWATRCGAGVVQLHGSETVDDARAVAESGPWDVWKAVRARSAEDVRSAVRTFAERVNGVLVDGWHPTRIGGAGVRVAWDELPNLRDSLPDGVRLVAAGGLTPENVADVVRRVRPHVVDVSSGVEERPGAKDPDRVRRFIQAVAFDRRGGGADNLEKWSTAEPTGAKRQDHG